MKPEIRPFLHVYPTSQLNGWAYLTDGICPSILRGGVGRREEDSGSV